MAIITVTEQNYEELVLKAERPVLVDFWAPWCRYCRRIAPALEKVAEQREGDLVVAKINADEEPELLRKNGVELLPTLKLFRNGESKGQIVAPGTKAEIDAFIQESLGGMSMQIYDMAVIGGGPGGYTAALYAARAGLNVVVLEQLSAGGQMALTEQIDNYPGFDAGIDGFTLGEQMQRGAEHFGAETILAEVKSVELQEPVKRLKTSEGTIMTRTVVIATGATPRPLGVSGEKEWTGRGVHYCAACDGMAYRGRTVAVIGGGNSAAEDALTLSRFAKKVYLIHRRDTLRAEKIYTKQLEEKENVEFCWNSTVEKLICTERLTGVQLRNSKDHTMQELLCDGIFVSVGRNPATGLLQGQVTMDQAGYLCADETTRTNLPGVFAAGDVRTKPLRQVVTAAADGAVAAHFAEQYLNEQKIDAGVN